MIDLDLLSRIDRIHAVLFVNWNPLANPPLRCVILEEIDETSIARHVNVDLSEGCTQQYGVSPIEAQGQKFDPHKHQAMFEVPDPTRPEGTVVTVVQAGYAIGDRVLRPAMVGIAKGGPAFTVPGGEPHIDKNA